MDKSYKYNATDVPLSSVIDQYVGTSDLSYDNYELLPADSDKIIITVNNEDDEVKKNVDAIVSIIKEYNDSFKLDLPTQVDDIRSIITGIASKADRDQYVVVLSEVADRVTLATITSLLVTISTLTTQLSSQAFLNSLTIAERVAILREFMDHIMKLTEIKEKLNVGNPIVEMKNAIKQAKMGDRDPNVDNTKIDEIINILTKSKK